MKKHFILLILLYSWPGNFKTREEPWFKILKVGIVAVITSDPPWQLYPFNLYLFDNVECGIYLVFLAWSVYFW